MLSPEQTKFRDVLLSPLKQKFYYVKNLPMALISGVRIVELDEKGAVTEIPFRWRNKNPFRSMYFAVQSMAAELSTAAPVFLALKAKDVDIAFILVKINSVYVKKARTKVRFSCQDYGEISTAISGLQQPGDTAMVTAETVGRDAGGDEVASFEFTWSFKVRS